MAGGHNGHGGFDRGIPGINGIPGHGIPYHHLQQMQALQISQNQQLTNQQNPHVQQHDPRNNTQNQTATPTIGPNGQIYHNPFFQPQQHNQQHYPNSHNITQTVLCASNLDAEIVKPDDLFTLFGVYGDVQRVKILYEKRDT